VFGERDTVLFVSYPQEFGGSVRSLETLLGNLEVGVQRVVAAPEGGRVVSALRESSRLDELLVSPRLSTHRRSAAAVRCVARITRWSLRNRRRLLAVHANGLAEMTVAAPAAMLTRRPLIVWVHNAEVTSQRSRRAIPVTDRLANVRWVAVSRAGREALVQSGARPERVTVVPNPIDPATVLANRTGSPFVTIGYLGDDTTRKGFDLLPGIWRRLATRDSRLVLFTTRRAELEPEAEQAWKELEEIPGVEVAGRQHDVRLAYARCDIVLIPSRAEALPRVAAEAMLNGIPVAASDLPGLRELGGRQAGILFPVDDVDGAHVALRRLLDDEALRSRLGEAGRRQAATYAPDQVAQRFCRLYVQEDEDLPT
jgi:glycosyltransferase involved in cell wall biosynthesis